MARSRTLGIGRLFGIELLLDSSWIFVFPLIVWGLTSTVQAWHPTWTTGTALCVALVCAMALFASVLVHELSHAFVAKLFKLPVRDITLHMFGGAANIGREPRTPGAELAIAIVGPLTSIALGIGMLALAPIHEASDVAALTPTGTLLVWLGPVNLFIGVFNLLPGFPMDGGRILRAALWKVTGDLRRATRWSTRGGEVVGFALVALGVAMAVGLRVPFFGTGIGSGVWLAFIGLFLRGAAKQHQLRTDSEEALEGVNVGAVMRALGPGVPANASIRSLVREWAARRDDGVYPVFFGDRFLGVVDVSEVSRVAARDVDEVTARDLMRERAQLPVVAPSDAAFDALQTLGASGLAALPVVQDGDVVGMLFARDLWLATKGGAARPLQVGLQTP